MSSPSRTRRGFTVVELLIVVFIIAVLAGMLLPGLAQALEAARGASCVSNLRQIGMAVIQYRTQNNDWFFPVSYPPRPNGSQSYFFGEVSPTGQLDPEKGYLVPYLEESGTVDRCPAFREGDFRTRFQVPGWGYAYNYWYLGQNGEAFSYSWGGQTYNVPKDMHAGHSVKKSVNTVLFADSARINIFGGGATPQNPVLEENFYLDPPSQNYDSVHFRHQRRANVLFVDAHVQSLPPVRYFTADGVDPRFGLTWRVGNFAHDDTLYDRE
jgi:prepilin-type N-terminal cleavage/methylation domain-containing protein/prepilin-type processing-associated H-X9-DG protein